MSSKQVEQLVKLRNALSMVSDALNEYIETLATTDVRKGNHELPCSESLKDLPWRSYKTKTAASQDESAWIFANTKGAEVLSATIRTKDKAQIDGFEYGLSGKDKQFISRKPLKTEP